MHCPNDVSNFFKFQKVTIEFNGKFNGKTCTKNSYMVKAVKI